MKTICLDAGAAPASPFWVTTGQAGGANQPILNASPAPRFNSQVQLGYCLLWTIACCLVQGCLVCLACHTWSTCLLIARHTFARRILGAAHYSLCVTTVQVPNQQLHHLAANTGQRLPLHMQVNGTSHLSARPQAYSAGLANATYIPGTGLHYAGAAPHLHHRAPIPHHASDASYLQQDPQALAAAAAAAAAAANAAVYKRTAGLPPHIQQQLLRSGQVLPNQAAPRPPNGLFETNDIDLSGTLPMLAL